jgi:uncharacterized membrane-anchored protein YhcB (DUF1043 family)
VVNAIWLTVIITLVVAVVIPLLTWVVRMGQENRRNHDALRQELLGIDGTNGLKGRLIDLEEDFEALREALPEEFAKTRHHRANEIARDLADLETRMLQMERLQMEGKAKG